MDRGQGMPTGSTRAASSGDEMSDRDESGSRPSYRFDEPSTAGHTVAHNPLVNRRADKVFGLANTFHDVPNIFAAASPASGRGKRQQQPSATEAATGPSPAVDLLRSDMDVFDNDVFSFCQKYLAVHHAEHRHMSHEHAALDQHRIYNIPAFRPRWHLILSLSQKTTAGRVITGIEGFVVLLSILTIILESIPAYNGDVVAEYEQFWFTVELIITAYFAVLTAFRFAVSPSIVSVVKAPMSWFDVVSLLPLFVQLAVQSRTYGWLKTLRLFRLVKLLRMFQYIDALVETLRRIATSLVAPFVLLAVFVIIFGNLMYWLEGGDVWTYQDAVAFINKTNYSEPAKIFALVNATVVSDCTCESTAAHLFMGAPCPPLAAKFLTAAHGMWYATASFTTVGYGDIVPECAPGKVITSLALLFSTIFIAMPIAIVGASFAETVVDHHNKIMLHKKLKARAIRDLRETNEKENLQSMANVKRRGARSSSSRTRRAAGHASSSYRSPGATPCEALFRYIASQLHIEHIDFNVETFRVAMANDETDGLGAAEGPASLLSGSVLETADGTESLRSASGALNEGRLKYRQLPLRAQFSTQLADTVDAYLAWLFEYWLLEYLDGRMELRAADASLMTVSTLVSPFARRGGDAGTGRGGPGQVSQYRESVQQQEEAEHCRLKATLREALRTRTGSLHPLTLFQAVDRAPGFAREVHLPRRCVTAVLGGRVGGGRNTEERRDRRRLMEQRSASQDGWQNAVGWLSMASDELWLPDVFGRFELSSSFAAHHLVFVPHPSSIDHIAINGVPLTEAVARQHWQSTTVPRDETNVAAPSEADVAAIAKRLMYAATMVDVHKLPKQIRHASATPETPTTMSAFDDLPPQHGGAVERTMLQRVFTVGLRCGDVIDFTYELRTTEDVATPPSTVTGGVASSLTASTKRHQTMGNDGGSGGSELELDAEVAKQQRIRRAAQLGAGGVRPISYRVVLE